MDDRQQTVGAAKLMGSMNPKARREDDRGLADGARKLSHMTLIFRRTALQQTALDRLLGELQNPLSPNFHRWLTADEFGKRFGASTEQLSRAADWLRSQGFQVESTAHGRNWIVFSGTVSQAQNAFHTEIHRYQAGAKQHFAPASAPSVPKEFAQLIVGIRGLDDFYLERPRRLRPMYTAGDGTHSLAPGDLSYIYNFSNSTTEIGQTVAVVGQSVVVMADIEQFRNTFQLPPNDPQVILAGDDPGIDSSGALQEADADLEWVGAVSRHSTIIYAYATDPMVAAQTVIDQNLAPILTFSFGNCEPDVSPSDATFIQGLAQQANAEGITWIAASGDSGAAACEQGSYPAAHGLSVSFPASLPEVTAVGGTEFNEGPNSWVTQNANDLTSVYGYLPEIAWNTTVQDSVEQAVLDNISPSF